MTYDELSAFIASFTNRSDLTSDIPTFIQMTEEAARVLRVRQMVKQAGVALTQGVALADAPEDFLGERSLMIGEWEVDYVTPEAMDTMQWRNLSACRPTHYTYVAGELQFYPLPDQAYTATLTYYGDIPALTADASNWLIEQFPEVYRDGCMVAASMKTRDTEAIAIYQARFEADLAKITQRFKDKAGRPLRVAPMFMQGRHRLSPSVQLASEVEPQPFDFAAYYNSLPEA